MNENAQADTRAANDNQPRACPNPSWEPDSVGRTREQLLYQAQITKLPLGFQVILNGIRYDGCRDLDQVMLEAKLANGPTFLISLPLRLLLTFAGYLKTMAQATEQNYGSGGRRVEWYYSDQITADCWALRFKLAGLNNITVKYKAYDEHYNYNLIRIDDAAMLRKGGANWDS